MAGELAHRTHKGYCRPRVPLALRSRARTRAIVCARRHSRQARPACVGYNNEHSIAQCPHSECACARGGGDAPHRARGATQRPRRTQARTAQRRARARESLQRAGVRRVGKEEPYSGNFSVIGLSVGAPRGRRAEEAPPEKPSTSKKSLARLLIPIAWGEREVQQTSPCPCRRWSTCRTAAGQTWQGQ